MAKKSIKRFNYQLKFFFDINFLPFERPKMLLQKYLSLRVFDGFYFIDLWRNTFNINYVPDSAEAKTKNFKKQWIHQTWSKYDLWSKNFEINEKHKTFDRAFCIIQNNCREMSHQKILLASFGSCWALTVGEFWVSKGCLALGGISPLRSSTKCCMLEHLIGSAVGRTFGHLAKSSSGKFRQPVRLANYEVPLF